MEDLVQAVHPGAAIREVLTRTGGEIAPVVEVVCTNPDVRLIVKTYPSDQRWKLAKERHVYGLLPEDVPAPRVLHASREKGALVLTCLPGQPLSEISASLPPDELHDLYTQMGRILASIHRRRMDAFGYIVDGVYEPVPTNTEYMTSHFTRHLRTFRDRSNDPDLVQRIQKYVDQRTDLWRLCDTPVLCHNDFHEGNVLVDKTPDGWHVTGIIDMENAVAADPLLDLAKTDSYAPAHSRPHLDGLRNAYGDQPPTWPEAFPLYRLHHALELWGWFATNNNKPPLESLANDMREIVHG
ncbi:phosphotransferase family protein [Actinomadura rupiterrae]|uniref:phosphotransferase family protein n=1 Tax=Actinomadura rupiterrae TaxID=559627 RepID=UPI0020A3E2B5|nr:aminoglycoside phosphotransferase family protein [Actinomadura rupiterrae]MCP2336264.1 aminoglycoside phosphotransferase (APT) family kinase protein [Actinomadura rupiterrae]